MGLTGLEKLCEREEINFEKVKKRGMRRSQIDTLLKTRESQKRVRVARLKKLHKGKMNQKFTEASVPSPIEPDDDEHQPSVGAGSLSKLDKTLKKSIALCGSLDHQRSEIRFSLIAPKISAYLPLTCLFPREFCPWSSMDTCN